MYQGSWSKGHSGHSVPTKVSLDKVSFWPKCHSAVNGPVGRKEEMFDRRLFFADFVPRTIAAQWDQNIFEGAFCNLLPGQCSGIKKLISIFVI